MSILVDEKGAYVPTTGLPEFDLFAGVVRQAFKDATKRNDESAVSFLDEMCPSWRRFVDVGRKRAKSRAMVLQGQNGYEQSISSNGGVPVRSAVSDSAGFW